MLGFDVIQREDLPSIMAAVNAGDARAAKLLNAADTAQTRIMEAPADQPMLRATCPRPLTDGEFALVIASASDGNPVHALALAVCTRCATTLPEIEQKAATSLRAIWPDLRQVTIGAGGRA